MLSVASENSDRLKMLGEVWDGISGKLCRIATYVCVGSGQPHSDPKSEFRSNPERWIVSFADATKFAKMCFQSTMLARGDLQLDIKSRDSQLSFRQRVDLVGEGAAPGISEAVEPAAEADSQGRTGTLWIVLPLLQLAGAAKQQCFVLSAFKPAHLTRRGGQDGNKLATGLEAVRHDTGY